MKKILIAAAMLTMPTVAMANPASSLSVQNATRSYATTPVVKSEKRKSQVVPVLIGAGIIAGVTYLIIDHENDNDRSDSN